ncbi:hypothetical protein PRK78_001345, partial [Emydomyces testavorans]
MSRRKRDTLCSFRSENRDLYRVIEGSLKSQTGDPLVNRTGTSSEYEKPQWIVRERSWSDAKVRRGRNLGSLLHSASDSLSLTTLKKRERTKELL